MGLHFMVLLIDSSLLKIKEPKINFLAKTYTTPFFHQNWNLFVPAPKSQHYLFIRYKNQGNWTAWEDVLGNCVENNRHYKFRGNEAMVLLFSNSLIYFINKVPASGLYKQSPGFVEFNVLNHEVSRYLALRHGLAPGQEYEILVHSTGAGDGKTLYVQSLSVIK